MATWKPFVQWKTNSGNPIVIHDNTITPQAKALIIKLPFFGFVWNRPVAILVEKNGQQQRLPIIDVTRMALLVLTGAGLTISLVTLLTSLFSNRTRNN